jgi:hypothetical protein
VSEAPLPIDLPQVAGEPLNYHWFGYAHAFMTSPVGQIDGRWWRCGWPSRLCARRAARHRGRRWRGSPYVGAVAAASSSGRQFSFTNLVGTVRYPGHLRGVAWHVDDLWVLVSPDRAAGGSAGTPSSGCNVCGHPLLFGSAGPGQHSSRSCGALFGIAVCCWCPSTAPGK